MQADRPRSAERCDTTAPTTGAPSSFAQNATAPQDEPSADLGEKPDDWLPPKESRESRRDSEKNQGTYLNRFEPAAEFDAMFQQLSERIAGTGTCIILFADATNAARAADVTAMAAVTLAKRQDQPVLLIDCDLEFRRLSEHMDMESRPGIANGLATQTSPDDIINETAQPAIDFVPAGQIKRKNWMRFEAKLTNILNHVRQSYGFVCVHLGDALGPAAELWAPHCEATYLVVSVRDSSRNVSMASVDHLRRLGARLLGCIATDATGR